MKEILLLAISYFLGSIPFGYIFSKIFAKKDVLKVGWKKTSGSNVFWHVSKLLGVLSGIFDLLKGSFAIYLAKLFLLSPQFQALCGLAAIFGHNWSFYLKFSGGRGIATFIGALLVLDPRVLFFSSILALIFFFFLNSPLATIFLILGGIIFSLVFQNQTAFFFCLLSLLPILIKRLSPIPELSFQKPSIIKNRLLYDRDEFLKTNFEKWISRK